MDIFCSLHMHTCFESLVLGGLLPHNFQGREYIANSSLSLGNNPRIAKHNRSINIWTVDAQSDFHKDYWGLAINVNLSSNIHVQQMDN